jgi:hypothetical protein
MSDLDPTNRDSVDRAAVIGRSQMRLGWEGATSNIGASLTWANGPNLVLGARRLARHGLGNFVLVPQVSIIGRWCRWLGSLEFKYAHVRAAEADDLS